MEEVEYVIEVLEKVKTALVDNDSLQLRILSNQTIHSASTVQDSGSITLAVVVYTLSKLIERNDHAKARNWNQFIIKLNAWISLSIKALEEGKYTEYEKYLEQTRKTLTNISVNLKSYIQEVLRKAAINKASNIYHHGISLGKTAQLLGITQWSSQNILDRKKKKREDI